VVVEIVCPLRKDGDFVPRLSLDDDLCRSCQSGVYVGPVEQVD